MKNKLMVMAIVIGIGFSSSFVICSQNDAGYWQRFKNYIAESCVGKWWKEETAKAYYSKNVIMLHEYIEKKTTRDWGPFFEEFVGAGDAILMFFAYYCGPCHNMAPIIDALAAEMSELKFVKVQCELFESLTHSFNIKTIPTLIFLRNREEVGRYDGGPLTKDELGKIILEVYSK